MHGSDVQFAKYYPVPPVRGRNGTRREMMKESDDIRLLNSEYDSDAQAVQKSELLPIYDAMSFSGDIQPLDDIPETERIVLDFETKKAESRNNEKKSSFKKKKIPSKRASWIKTLIACAVIAVVVAGAMAGAYFGVTRADKNVSPVTVVYRTTDKSTTIRLADGESYDIGEAREISVSTDGMYVWFSRNTSSATGKYDLRMIEVGSKKSLKKQGKFIEKGIDEGWKTTKDGLFACYGITKSNITSCYMYSTELQKAETVAESVEEYYPPSVGNTVYFTRRSGNVYSLHRAKFGDNRENVASRISHVKYTGDSNDYEIIYTQQTGKSTNVNVYSVKSDEKPVQICEDVGEVYLNDYTYGGNLYYFKKNTSNINWQDFITDDYYDSDMKIQKPIESDYMVEKGFIFKRRVLDTAKYNAAKHQYEMKAVRDQLREELDKLDLGLAVGDEYTCYAYKSGTSHRLVSGVKLENVVEFEKSGDPGLIYKKTVIGVGDSISMDSLTEIARSSSVQKAMDYVRNAVQSSYDVSDSSFCSRYDGTKVFEYELSGYDVEKTQFIFGSSNAVYGITDSELYYSVAENTETANKRLIDSKVSDCVSVGNTVYYEKLESNGARSLYKFLLKTGKAEICKNVYSYFAVSDSFTIILARQNDSEELVSVGIYDGTGYALVDSDLNLNNFVYSDDAFAYIKNYKSGSGDLYCYSLKNGAVKCGSGVTGILYIG